MPPLSSPPPTLNNNNEDDDVPSAILSNLSCTSCRHILNCLYMQWKHAETSSGVMLLDPTWLKPGCKVSIMSKYRWPYGDTNSGLCMAICDHIRSSMSSSALGSMLTTCAQMVWTCSTSVGWDTSCSAFSLSICLCCGS